MVSFPNERKKCPEYTLFFGCIIPGTFSLHGKINRLVLSRLAALFTILMELHAADEKHHKTHRGPGLVRNSGKKPGAGWKKEGHGPSGSCNGCYSTLKSVEVEMPLNPGIRRKWTNIWLLQAWNTGNDSVKHLVAVFMMRSGYPGCKQQITNPSRVSG